MAKIVLCGAPNSGKSELAIELERTMRKHGKHPTSIIDNYTKEVSGRYDLGVGIQGSYLVDLAVAVERLAQEYAAAREGNEHFIVVGSLAETSIHTALNCEYQQDDIAWSVANIIMPVWPLMRRSSGEHTTYLLPLGEDPDAFETTLYENLPLALEGLGIKYATLPLEHKDLWIDYILYETFGIGDVPNSGQD